MVLVAAVCAIASSALLVRWADASAVTLAFWRTLGGSALLSAAVVVGAGAGAGAGVGPSRTGAVEAALTRPPDRAQWQRMAVAGLALAIHFSAWLASLELTSVAASVTLVSTAPMMIALWDLARGRGPSSATIIALALAIVGTVVIALGDRLVGGDAGPDAGGFLATDDQALLGDALALVGAAAMAVYLVVGASVRERLSTIGYGARTYGLAAAALATGIVAADLVGYHVAVVDLSARTWMVVAAMILGPQLIGHTGLNFLLDRLGPLSVGLALLIEPVAAGALAWAVLGEAPTAAVMAGAPLVIGALLLHLLGSR